MTNVLAAAICVLQRHLCATGSGAMTHAISMSISVGQALACFLMLLPHPYVSFRDVCEDRL